MSLTSADEVALTCHQAMPHASYHSRQCRREIALPGTTSASNVDHSSLWRPPCPWPCFLSNGANR